VIWWPRWWRSFGPVTRGIPRTDYFPLLALLGRRLSNDAVADLHRHQFTVLMDQEWKHDVAAAVDITLLGGYYERFADHAVEIGRRVIFQTTGTTA
jgi:hypothetical protein